MISTVDEYIARQPAEVQPLLAQIRAVIREALPGAEERISYNMPGYFRGEAVIWFAANKRHIGLYPRTAAVAAVPGVADLKGTKGSVHLPLDRPIPVHLIQAIVRARLEELNPSGGEPVRAAQ